MTVTNKLIKHFPVVMDFKFTSHMEDELDEIEEGKIKRDQVLTEFYEPFSEALKAAETEMESLKGQESGENCPLCGKQLVSRYGKRGAIWGCSGYPDCKFTKPGEGEQGREAPVATDQLCPECGKRMLQRMGPRGPFLGCSAYPKCRSTKPIPEEMKEKIKALLPPPPKKTVPAVEVHETCPECGAPMKLRPGCRGFFLGCSKYPKCKGTREAPPE